MLPVRTFKPVITALAIAVTFLSASASADESIPFKGKAWETITQFNPQPDGTIDVTTTGEGQATHLGRFFRIANATIHPDGTVDGITGWIAADGDFLILELNLAFVSPTSLAGTYEIVFGNGRFAGAEGGADIFASTTDGAIYNLTFKGEIDY